jgi:hypothetical protein
LLPLLWLQASLPGLVCIWLLFGEAIGAWLGGGRTLPDQGAA